MSHTSHTSHTSHRYAEPLSLAHDGEHLTKFEELLEAAVDLDRIPDEFLICATYDPRLEVGQQGTGGMTGHRRAVVCVGGWGGVGWVEAAVDLDRIPDEFIICATYDPCLSFGGGW